MHLWRPRQRSWVTKSTFLKYLRFLEANVLLAHVVFENGEKTKNLVIPLCCCQKIFLSFLFLMIYNFSKKSSIISYFSYKIGHKTFENFAKTQESFILAKSLPDSTILTSKLKQHAGFSFQIYVNFSLIDFRSDSYNLKKFSF